MAGYTRSYNKADDEFIDAIDFVNEYSSLELAFNKDSGHIHNGAIGNGSYVPVISDLANNNEILVDGVGSQLTFSINDAGAKTEQLRISDGVITPTLTNDIDLGTVSNKFKNLHIAGNASLASLSLATGANVSIIYDDDTMVNDSATALATQQSIKAYTDNLSNSHLHNGTNGSLINLIASADNLNVVEINDVTNAIVMSVDVAGVKTNKLTVDNNSVYPVADLGIDLGLNTNKFNNFHAANANILSLNLSGVAVSNIYDEDAMGSNSATALATQQSIKAYVDTSLATGGVAVQAQIDNINAGLGTISRITVPATAKGQTGDTAGMIASDATYIYLCHTTWVDGVADIWSRTAITTW